MWHSFWRFKWDKENFCQKIVWGSKSPHVVFDVVSRQVSPVDALVENIFIEQTYSRLEMWSQSPHVVVDIVSRQVPRVGCASVRPLKLSRSIWYGEGDVSDVLVVLEGLGLCRQRASWHFADMDSSMPCESCNSKKLPEIWPTHGKWPNPKPLLAFSPCRAVIGQNVDTS